MKKFLSVALASLFTTTLSDFAHSEDAYEVKYPPYVKSVYQKIDFSVQCVVAYQMATKSAIDDNNEERARERSEMWEENLKSLV